MMDVYGRETMTNENDGQLPDRANAPQGGDPPSNSESPWSVEHYGFGGEAVHVPTFDATASVSQTSAVGASWVRVPTRRLSRTKRVLAGSAVGLAVMGGLGGVAVAQATTDTGSTSPQVTQVGPQDGPGPAQRFDRDDGSGRGPRR